MVSAPFVKNQLIVMQGLISGLSLLSYWSICLSLCQSGIFKCWQYNIFSFLKPFIGCHSTPDPLQSPARTCLIPVLSSFSTFSHATLSLHLHLALIWSLDHAEFFPVPGPLHILFHLPEMGSPALLTAVLSLNVTFSKRPPLTPLSKVVPLSVLFSTSAFCLFS